MRFTDQTLIFAGPSAPDVDLHAFDLITTTSNYRDNFDIQSFNNSNGTSLWNTTWVESATAPTWSTGTRSHRWRCGPGRCASLAGNRRRDDHPSSQPGRAGATTLSYDFGYNNIDPGETLTVQFASDGVKFVTIQTIRAGEQCQPPG